MEVKSRHHLRSDGVRDLAAALEPLGIALDADSYELVELEGSDFELVLVDGEPLACYVESAEPRPAEPFVTVRGANALDPDGRLVTVDAGAVSFVSDGADVMRPGIVAADETIAAGDLVVVVEETHGKALAVGRARVPGEEMVGSEGKVVDTLHHVGDDLYDFSV